MERFCLKLMLHIYRAGINMLGFIRRILRNYLHDRRVSEAIRSGLVVGKNTRLIGKIDFGSEPYLVRIGHDVTISFDVAFVTHDGGTWIFREEPEFVGVTKYGPIVIGDGCFVGARTIILPNVSIGARSLIGAGSLVIGDIPADSVAAGVPAKVLMTRREYAEKCASAGQRVGPRNKRQELELLFAEKLGRI